MRKITVKNCEILIVDYSDLKPSNMAEVLVDAKRLIKKENMPVLVLSIFRNNFLTPDFMRQVEREVREVENLIEKNTIIGLSEVQKWILKGMNMWYKRQLYHFATKEEALEFLTKPN